MPDLETSTVNETLSTYAVGFMADRQSSLLDEIAPIVPVGVTRGDYKYFKDAQSFQTYDTELPSGTESPTIGFKAVEQQYNCKPNGLKIPSLDEDQKAAPENMRQIIQNNKLNTLLSVQLVNREVQGFKKIFDTIDPEPGMGAWTGTPGAAADIIAEIDDLILRINNQTGQIPEHIGLGLGAWAIIKRHPSVLSQVGGIHTAVTPEVFAGMTLNPSIKVHIGRMPYNANPRGLNSNMKGVVGNEVLVYHRSDSPNTEDMSAVKTFSVTPSLLTGVYKIREEIKHIEFDEVRWTEDVRVTAPISIARISIT